MSRRSNIHDEEAMIEHPFIGRPRAFDEADADFRFGTSVAMAGLLLRHTDGTEGSGFEDVNRLAAGALGEDPHGQRAEFLGLIKRLTSRYNMPSRGH